MDRYVFVRHEVPSLEGIRDLIAQHEPGRGARAQVSLTDREVTHVYALQGETTEELDRLTADAVGQDTVLLSLDVCKLPPCALIGKLFDVTPMYMPPYDIYVFLYVELIVEVEVEGDFVLPDIRSEMAGVPVEEGRALLVQLAGDDLELLLHDLGAWAVHEGVGRVRAFLGSGSDMVRAPSP